MDIFCDQGSLVEGAASEGAGAIGITTSLTGDAAAFSPGRTTLRESIGSNAIFCSTHLGPLAEALVPDDWVDPAKVAQLQKPPAAR